MTDALRLTGTEPQRQDSDVVQLALLRRRLRSRALLVVFLGLAGLFYAMTIARFGEHDAARRTAAQPSPEGRMNLSTTLPVQR
jgi:hypothetical protein